MGLKDVIQMKDYPKDDPEFDEDNLRYSCIRYIPTDRGGSQGPSWADPRTGEMFCANAYYRQLARKIADYAEKSDILTLKFAD